MLRAKTFLSKKSVKILICCLLAVIVSLCVLGFNVSSSSSTTIDPQFKFKAKITGSVCEIWGTSPVKEEGKNGRKTNGREKVKRRGKLVCRMNNRNRQADTYLEI